MPRAFLITNRRYSSVVDDEDLSWSIDGSPEREVSLAEGPLYIDNDDSSNDFVDDDDDDDDDDFMATSPKSSVHESNETSKDISSSSGDSSDATNTLPSPVQQYIPHCVPGRNIPPYVLSTCQPTPPVAAAISSQPCVISCCYTNADLMAVIQQLMRQNPVLKKIRATPPTTSRPEIRPKAVGIKNPVSSSSGGNVASLPANRDVHVCPECGKRYSTSSNLARHRQTHRSVTDKKARKCPHCDKIYVSMPAYSMHVRTHSQGCQCPYCGKCFSRAWLLQGHIRVHTGEKPFSCNVCHKAFADKSNLRAHIQTHSNSKPYLCERCGKAFALKSYLYKHEESSCMRSHKQREKSPSESSPETATRGVRTR